MKKATYLSQVLDNSDDPYTFFSALQYITVVYQGNN
jgi:hypothetical protein